CAVLRRNLWLQQRRSPGAEKPRGVDGLVVAGPALAARIGEDGRHPWVRELELEFVADAATADREIEWIGRLAGDAATGEGLLLAGHLGAPRSLDRAIGFFPEFEADLGGVVVDVALPVALDGAVPLIRFVSSSLGKRGPDRGDNCEAEQHAGHEIKRKVESPHRGAFKIRAAGLRSGDRQQNRRGLGSTTWPRPFG